MTESNPASSAKSSFKPYATLDMWRGIACLGVVLNHEGALLVNSFPSLAPVPLYRVSAFGYLGVQMFFVISGYCIAGAACSTLRRGEGWTNFMHARARRVYPPFWFSLIIFAASSLLASALVASGRIYSSELARVDILHQSVGFYVSNLTLTQLVFHQSFLSTVSWTLCYEMAFYVIVSLFLLGSRSRGEKREEKTLLTGLHCVTLGALLLLTAVPQFRFFPLDLWPQFGLGIVVFDVLKHPAQTRPKWWMLAVVLLTTAFVLFRSFPMGLYEEPSRLTFAFAAGFALLLLSLYRHDAPLGRLPLVRSLAAIGLFSYSLYLTHFLTLGIINQAFRLTRLPASAHLLILMVCVVVSVLAARLFFQVFEKPFVHAKRRTAP